MEIWRTCHTELAFDHPVLRVERATRRLVGGDAHDFTILYAPHWVNVMLITPQG
ncbi:hypothetical protein DFAR_3290009 [Desulfarculales bacterium]